MIAFAQTTSEQSHIKAKRRSGLLSPADSPTIKVVRPNNHDSIGRILIVLLVVVSPNVVGGEEVLPLAQASAAEAITDETPKKTIEFPSPDGKFFRYSSGKSQDETQTYHLIEKTSGKIVTTVAESDPDLGHSTRFHIECYGAPTPRRSPSPPCFGSEEPLSPCLSETVIPFARSTCPSCRSKSPRRPGKERIPARR